MDVEGQWTEWWKDQLAADIHQALRVKELKLPAYRAHSPQISMRRYFADLLAMLSNRCQLCHTARHLAVYLLDLFMDHYDVAFKQLYVIALSCLLLASKFEEKEDHVPKLEQLNALGFMRSLNLVLNKQDLIRMELLLLETFGWNLCLPTAAHFIDYYLSVSVQEGDLHNGWPLCSLSKTRAFMDKYSNYFLEVSLQDHTFLSFRPSQIAAACVAASRICLQISPGWTAALHLLTGYTWDHLAQCVELMLIAHDNDLQGGNKAKSSPLQDQTTLQTRNQSANPSSSSSSTYSQHLLFHPGSYSQLSQHSGTLSQLHITDTQVLGPVVPEDYLQSHRVGLFSSSAVGSALHSYPELGSGLHSLSTQGSLSMQVSLMTEPRHCLDVTYGGGYVSSHHSFAASCFDR
ncbi:cyclin-J-like [Scleropages formosus]|uniref:Cyclin-J-like protein n=1 Tax=Scleropages formosus TaxID=113540 RepID=A0A8C9V8K5_SCLFO|nr:cyclin-J-like [Scleropages formosus]XP_018607745.1 cyclin-J-like [Scleropages formosus]XP_018607746.1 cyclin-J-like [Scleropages formosus]XP_018607747.1 cyclin-J-like [Scleropages formosus]